MKKERILYIDFMRGICIVFMLLGHIKINETYDWYSHIYLGVFFFLSGLFINREKPKEFIPFIKNLTKKIIIPYIFWGLIFYLIAIITKINFSGYKENLLQIITVNNQNGSIAGALWFLTAFYFCQIINYILNKFIKNDYAFVIISLIIMFIGINLNNILSFELWWSLGASFVGVGLYALGYIFKKYDLMNKTNIKNKFIIILLFVINFVMIMKSEYVNMRLGNYPNIVIFLINFLIMIIVYSNISRILLSYEKMKFFTDNIIYMGENSMIYLCLNQIVIKGIEIILKPIPIFDSNIIVEKIVHIILSFTILYWTTKIVSKTKFKMLFGK